MAILQYKIRDQFVEELEITFSPSKHGPTSYVTWVHAKVAFRFFSGFPEISIERDGQEMDDVEGLIRGLKDITQGKGTSIDFYPREPDYNIKIKRYDESYEIIVVLDVSGTQKTGVYCGNGPALYISSNKKDLIEFASTLEKEIEYVKQEVKNKMELQN